MPKWYAVTDKAKGTALSFGTEVADKLPATLAAIEIDHPPGPLEVWDSATKTVIPRTPTVLEVKAARLAALRAKGWSALSAAEKAEAQGLAFDLGQWAPS